VNLALAQEVDYTEKNGAETDPVLAGIVPVRSHLSMLAWSTHAEPLNCASGPLSKTGVMTMPMDDALGEKLMVACVGA
jgi:hypothetical protein